MPIKNVKLYWSGGGIEFSLLAPYSNQSKNRLYSFGHFLDSPEQQWLMDEIAQHLKYYSHKADSR
jgi:hypothetical protein